MECIYEDLILKELLDIQPTSGFISLNSEYVFDNLGCALIGPEANSLTVSQYCRAGHDFMRPHTLQIACKRERGMASSSSLVYIYLSKGNAKIIISVQWFRDGGVEASRMNKMVVNTPT